MRGIVSLVMTCFVKAVMCTDIDNVKWERGTVSLVAKLCCLFIFLCSTILSTVFFRL